MVIIYATQYDMIGADMLGLGLQTWPSTSRVQAPTRYQFLETVIMAAT